MLHGRRAERDLLDELLEGVRRGRSGSVVVAGAAGIGKSALVRYAAEQALDTTVLQVRGVQAETGMPFAGLHALLRPVRDRLPSLSAPQRRALGAALGFEAGEAPSRFLVAAAVVELLATLAEERPVVGLVDDAQWIDHQSLGALTFAARRLRDDRVALIFTLRTETATQPGPADRLLADLEWTRLGPLEDEAADRLLDERSDLERTARQTVRAAAQGNPLALVALSADGRTRTRTEPLALTRHLEADYLSRTVGLGPGVRRLLLLAAVDDTGDLTVLLTAAGRQDASEADLTVTGNRVAFVHPLVRSAIYQDAPSTVRRQAHLALAESLADLDPARATWHRASAAVPPAEEMAAELADLGAAAVRRAATDLAARAYERAAELTADPQRRLGWLLDAAETSWDSGQVERAATLIATTREAPETSADPGRIDELRGRLVAATGSALQGCEILIQGAEPILEVAPHRAAAMLAAAVRAASVAGDMDRVIRAGQLAMRLMHSEARPAAACFAAGIAELLTGVGAGAVAALKDGIAAAHDSSDPELLSHAATAAAFTADWTQTCLLASRAVTRCRETGALGTLAQALEPLSVALMDTSPRQAEASADEGLRAARETDQVGSEAIHLAALAAVAALRGDRARTEELAREALALDRVHGLAYPAARAVSALGLLELGLGRPTQALLHYERLTIAGGHRAAQLAAVDFAMLAAVWSGRTDRAHELLVTFASWHWMHDADEEWAPGALDRWRAMLAEPAEATVLFQRSLAHQARSVRPFFEALTHLLLGEHLRRMRQRSAARPHFRAAMEIFERLDAVPWTIRARNELRATGESVRRHDDGAVRLTPQELQVAQLVATGASTKAVAAQLYLSPRTVDSHLRQVFTKLGISSRAALRDVDLTG